MSDFVNLHTHDEYSLLDGLGKASQWTNRVKQLGQTHLGIANHGNIDGAIKSQKACTEAGVKLIIGCEFYIVEDLSVKQKGDKRKHICVYAMDKDGFQNILQMLTIANIEGFYYRPRIDPKTLLMHNKGILTSTACASSYIGEKWGIKLLKQLHEANPEQTFLEIMPHQLDEQIAMNEKVLQLHKKMGIPIVATNDCHYPDPDGSKCQEVLLAIQRRVKWSDPDRWKFDVSDLYLKSSEEMLKAFRIQRCVPKYIAKKSISNTKLIAEMCENFSIESREVFLPKVPGYENRDETELLKELVKKGFKQRVVNGKAAKPLSEYKKRLSEEFRLICKLKFQRYFLIVWELINWCKENDIMTGPGRGSVGGCLIAYCLGITNVDPIKYGLLFSRFISPARIDLPDIDMDFEDIKREKIRQHLQECYGEYNVAGVSTFLQMKGRAALRDVARVFEIPNIDVDSAAKSIVVRSGGDFRSDFSIEDAFDTFEDGIKFKKKYPEVTRLSTILEGQVRGSGQHAAAMCISSDDLRHGKRCNLCKRKDTTVVNWDKTDSEYMGLMKLDVLGLSALTILNNTRKMVKENHGADIVFDDIDLEDPKVLSEISKGHTVGAFQIGSLGLAKYCQQLGIDSFEDIVNATSLWRPGTLRSGMTSEFTIRKKGESEWNYAHPALEELTKDTLGIILYQEQVMMFMYDLAGLNWKTCDTVRKVISKSQGDDLFRTFKDKFVEGCKKKKTLDPKTAAKVWNELSSFGSYGFNKSHAVEYSMITFWDMWCKVYYPAEFMACSLTYGGSDKKDTYVAEAKRLGLKVELPKIGRSHTTNWTTDGERLFTPFLEIKGVGVKSAEKISNLKQNKEGFFEDTESKNKPNKTIMAHLDKMKAFEDHGEFTEDQLEELSELFSFDITRDPMGKIRGIIQLFETYGYMSKLSRIDYSKPTENLSNYVGKINDLRFGYRKNILKAKSKGGPVTDLKGTADNLGGAYGFFESENDAAQSVFDGAVYSKKKEKVEHCAGKWLVVRACSPRKLSNNIFISDFCDEDDLLSCQIENLGFKLFSPVNMSNTAKMKGLSSCSNCPLKEECSAPVQPSIGSNNIMIIGEAPGKYEDKVKQGFVGESGKLLWSKLASHNLKRDDFWVTNIVKCYPSVTKTPTRTLVSKCSKWLKKEFNKAKPPVVLAFGNTSIKYFKNENSGIMSLSGTTTWDRKHNCWICWCIHPAAVLYHRENEKIFEEGVDNFVKCLRAIGMKTKGDTNGQAKNGRRIPLPNRRTRK